jgi:hypothetical protein
MPELTVPPATADRVTHADWLELQALAARDRNSSMQDFASALRSTGSSEQLEDEGAAEEIDDRGGETTEPIAAAAFAEIEDRCTGCGGHYPFELGEDFLQLKGKGRGAAYVFLLLLSTFGKDAAPAKLNAPQLFEELSAVALGNCLGGQRNGVKTYHFGFPRRVGPPGFQEAVDKLCLSTGEGTACKDRPTRKDQKDAALDLVAWRPFPDGRRAIVMAWGQCATGANWDGKLSEMQPAEWSAAWLRDRPVVLPLRTFFMPHCVADERWEPNALKGGVLFDRCRIAALAHPLPGELQAQCVRFNRHVIAEIQQ